MSKTLINHEVNLESFAKKRQKGEMILAATNSLIGSAAVASAFVLDVSLTSSKVWLFPALVMLVTLMSYGIFDLVVKNRAKDLWENQVHTDLKLHLIALQKAINSVPSERRSDFDALWLSAVDQSSKTLVDADLGLVKNFLQECRDTVQDTNRSEERLLSVLAQADRNDERVSEVLERFSLMPKATEALDELKARLVALKEVTKEFDAAV